ncbi:response regulator transcription factor [bacterium]|nr:response regulator transcription factor [bacterium]
MSDPLRLLLADDHQIIRQGLCSLLAAEHDICVVAEAVNGREVLKLAREHCPDMVILDISMPELNGIEAARQIVRDFPAMKIVMLSMHADRRFIQETLDIGASAYLLKDAAFEELVEAIHCVMQGGQYLSRSIRHLIISTEERRKICLTAREREVLQLMAEGDNTKTIAHKLSISVKTIETHRQHIMRKLDIHSVAGLTKYAIKEGLTGLY